ncbi:TPA: hypothetical protein HA253_04300, partial [Candidatus Woesearchaeota archaeon]|nr:hypothetical protein [Candidatus Woesearchaeota archaeon]
IRKKPCWKVEDCFLTLNEALENQTFAVLREERNAQKHLERDRGEKTGQQKDQGQMQRTCVLKKQELQSSAVAEDSD